MLSTASATDPLALRSGDLSDYAALAEFHYLRRKPVTATRVLVLEDDRPTVVGRLLGRAADESRVVGVLVESLPALSCSLRDHATAGRYAAWADRAAAARLLNHEVRCISRVVVHPQWRGLGLAVRLVREALANMTTPYTEALAAMGRVHPFFRRAGMTEYRRPPHPRDQRLLDALDSTGLPKWALSVPGMLTASPAPAADRDGVSLTESQREFLRAELARWAGRRLTIEQQLAAARDRLLREPVYYLKAKDDSHDDNR